MSYPFLIWTMRRTGGTTLASLVMEMSEHIATEHEPFNIDRKFGWVSKAWQQDKDKAALEANIDAFLQPGRKVKHCYEIVPQPVNAALMQLAGRYDYRHVILDRDSEVDRILSLELAKLTGAWGKDDAQRNYLAIERGEVTLPPLDIPAALHHLQLCRKQRKQLAQDLAGLGITPFVVTFEQVYSDFDAGRERVLALLAHLGIDPAAFPDFEERVSEAILSKGQNSARISRFVPNLEEAQARLQAALDQPLQA